MNETAMVTSDVVDVTALAISRAPDEVLEEAHRAAKALMRVVEGKARPVKFNDETYLEFEDWQTVGRFYGIAPRIVATRPVTLGPGDVTGWEATAEAVHVPTGRVVSSADAMCLTDEEKWRARAKYEWHYALKGGGTSAEDPGTQNMVWEDNPNRAGKKRPRKERVLVGEEAVPQFQLRSMAQTRAGAKALRNALAWVVVLAGYRPTPAEEMLDHPGPARMPGGGDSAPSLSVEIIGQPDRPVTEPEAYRAESESLFATPEDQALRKRYLVEGQRLAKAVKRRDVDFDLMVAKITYGCKDPLTAPLANLREMLNWMRSRIDEGPMEEAP